MKRITSSAIIIAVSLVFVGSAFAESAKDIIEKKKAKQEAALAEAAKPKPAINEIPGQTKSQAMEGMKVYTYPGQSHEVLADFEGIWTFTAKMWMNSSSNPDISKGTSENERIYGGRFLKQTVKGTMAGEEFKGVGYLGYDNIKGVYVMTWLDNMTTGIFNMSGSYDNLNKTLKLSGENSCPMTQEKNRAMRWEWSVLDKNHNTFSSYTKDADGKSESKNMEILYTRV